MDKKVLVLAALLTGCGGAGSGGQGAGNIMGTSVPQGAFTGTTNNGRAAAGLVLPDGSFYVIYTAAQNANLIGGAMQGTLTPFPGSFIATNVKDVNLEGAGVLTVGIEGSYVPKDRLTATINYLTLGQSIAISATYLPGYDTPASLASVVGSYTGTAGGVGGTEVVTLDISDTGALTGVSAGGCHFTGQATPLQTINAFTVALNFGGAPCVAPGQKMSGAAHFDSATQRLYMVGMLSDRSNGAVFSGTKLDHRN